MIVRVMDLYLIHLVFVTFWFLHAVDVEEARSACLVPLVSLTNVPDDRGRHQDGNVNKREIIVAKKPAREHMI